MPQQAVNQSMRALQKQRDALKAQHAALRKTQRALLFELHAGAKLCEGLTFLQAHLLQYHQQHNGDSGSDSDSGSDDRAALLGQLAADMFGWQEAQLLKQLTGLQDSGSDDGNEGRAIAAWSSLEQLVAEQLELGDPGVQTVSPPHDPLAYMRDQFSAPVPPGAATITAEQLAGIYKEVLTEASMLLHGLDCEPDATRRQDIVQQLRQHWDRYLQACVHSATVDVRKHNVQSSYLFNLSTMQVDVEGAMQHEFMGDKVMQQLGLTQQQRELIAAGARLCVRQVERLNAEVAQLGQENGCSSGSSASSSGSDGTFDSSPAAAEARRARLADEQQRLLRLNRLLLKGWWARMLGVSWVIGCLSWEQVTKGAAACWPFAVRWAVMGAAVDDS